MLGSLAHHAGWRNQQPITHDTRVHEEGGGGVAWCDMGCRLAEAAAGNGRVISVAAAQGRPPHRRRGGPRGRCGVRCALHPVVFDWDFPMRRLFLLRNIETQRTRPVVDAGAAVHGAAGTDRRRHQPRGRDPAQRLGRRACHPPHKTCDRMRDLTHEKTVPCLRRATCGVSGVDLECQWAV
jgi:hypothetical protein